MISPPLVSIVIITLNTPRLTRACLRSVTRNTSVPYEVLLINNGPAGRAPKSFRSFPRLRLIQNSKNVGFAKAANQGALASRGRYVCFLNSDTLVPPGWLQHLLEAFQHNAKTGAVGPTSQKGHGYRFQWPPSNWPASETMTALADEALRRRSKQRYESVPFLWGCCLLIPKPILAQVGLFDEGFFYGVEDIDYSFSLRLHGYRLIRVRSVFVHHQGQGSCTSEERRRMVERSEQHFIDRWTSPLDGRPRRYAALVTYLNRKLPIQKAAALAIRKQDPAPPSGSWLIRTGFVANRDSRPHLTRFSDLQVFALTAPVWKTWKSLKGPAVRELVRTRLIIWTRPKPPARVRVTVMMAAHNAEAWISEAIDSVLSQRFRDFELIIADDGSTDRTAERIQPYRRHPQVRFLQNPTTLGIPTTRNQILRAARGSAVAVCDADDLMLATFLQRMVPLLEEKQEVGWVYSDRFLISDTGNPLGIEPAMAINGRREFRRNVVAHAGALIRRSLMLAVGGYDETLLSSEDYDLALKIAERSKILCLPGEIHYLWRRHPRSSSAINPWASRETEQLLARARRRRERAGSA